MKVYDCFAYFNEDMLLDLRLNILWDVVDYFVIVEGRRTFTGIPKDLNFRPERFAKFREKIRYIVYDGPMDDVNPWVNEAKNKDAVMEGLFDAEPGDVIVFSDVDEIPNPQAIVGFDTTWLYACLDQKMYNYWMNNLVLDPDGSPREWQAAKITTYRNLVGFFGAPSNLRFYKKQRDFFGLIRNVYRKMRRKVIHDGGWHFSWVMEPEGILLKMLSISHSDMAREEFANLDHIRRMIHERRDVWERDRLMKVVPISEDFLPGYVVKNKDIYSRYLVDN